MKDVEFQVKANTDSATKNVAGLREEYRGLIKDLSQPIRNIGSYQALEQGLTQTGTAVVKVKAELRDLQGALLRVEQPTAAMKARYKELSQELARLQRLESQQVRDLGRLRGELTGAGVDTRNLAREQARLKTELEGVATAGRRDEAVRGIKQRNAELAKAAQQQRAFALASAKDNLGVGRMRAAKLEIAALRKQYELLRTTGGLSSQELSVAAGTLKQRIAELRREMKGAAAAGGNGGGFGVAGLGRAGAVGAGVAALGVGATQVAGGADAVGRLDARLRLATKSQEEFNIAQSELDRIADATQGDITALAELYGKLNRPLNDVGFGQQETLNTVEAVALSLKIGGASAAEADGAVRQFAQGMASGTLRGDEFNSVIEQSDRLAGALADSLGVTVGELRQMATDGQLTSESIVQALQQQLPKLREEMSGFAPEIGAGFDRIFSELKLKAGRAARDSGISGFAGFVLNNWAKSINGGSDQVTAGFDATLRNLQTNARSVQQAMLADQRAWVGEMKTLNKDLAESAKAELKNLVKAEQDAQRDLDNAKQAQLDTEKRYKDALIKLKAGPQGEASFSQATALKAGARQALQNGDIDTAKAKAQEALSTLQALAEAGQSTYGFTGIIQELASIEKAADKQNADTAEQKKNDLSTQIEQIKQQLASIEKAKISVQMDDDAAAAAIASAKQLAAALAKELVVPVRPTVAATNAAPTNSSATTPEFYSGGYTGPGSKYQFAGFVHADEHVQPKEVVREPGALSFLERIRRNGFRNTLRDVLSGKGYAMGGLVTPNRMSVALPSLPAATPAGPTGQPVILDLGSLGQYQGSMPSDSLDALQKQFRIQAIKSGRPR
ncbi:tape measure protein [Atopomonas sediminilitoris]|uniref:tape measure protein n=1 Tax=Atopomonas sediminilitoris TaxID=2919919 RepID=UPI001F4D3FF2|nr:tape measure protein [Atopomonas sediminilitoris]MCJ8168630.1 tape measure protein [Atopomonas sediminilitoris]